MLQMVALTLGATMPAPNLVVLVSIYLKEITYYQNFIAEVYLKKNINGVSLVSIFFLIHKYLVNDIGKVSQSVEPQPFLTLSLSLYLSCN